MDERKGEYRITEEEIKSDIIKTGDKVLHDRETNKRLGRKHVKDEQRLKGDIERYHKMQSLRNNFSFERDLSTLPEDSTPLDVAIRDKIKDNNFLGYIKKDIAENQINKIRS